MMMMMKMKSCFYFGNHLLLLLLSSFRASLADEPPLQDTCPAAPQEMRPPLFINGFTCKNPAAVTASDFKTAGLAHPGDTVNLLRSSDTILTAAEFPGLNTLGLSVGRTDLDVHGVVLPHSHPRASEVLYVSQGEVLAGFVDTGGRLFQAFLGEGDVFVFPRGLLHFCFNLGFGHAAGISVYGGQNPGVADVAAGVFLPDPRVAEKIVSALMGLGGLTGPRYVAGNGTATKDAKGIMTI